MVVMVLAELLGHRHHQRQVAKQRQQLVVRGLRAGRAGRRARAGWLRGPGCCGRQLAAALLGDTLLTAAHVSCATLPALHAQAIMRRDIRTAATAHPFTPTRRTFLKARKWEISCWAQNRFWLSVPDSTYAATHTFHQAQSRTAYASTNWVSTTATTCGQGGRAAGRERGMSLGVSRRGRGGVEGQRESGSGCGAAATAGNRRRAATSQRGAV